MGCHPTEERYAPYRLSYVEGQHSVAQLVPTSHSARVLPIGGRGAASWWQEDAGRPSLLSSSFTT